MASMAAAKMPVAAFAGESRVAEVATPVVSSREKVSAPPVPRVTTRKSPLGAIATEEGRTWVPEAPVMP